MQVMYTRKGILLAAVFVATASAQAPARNAPKPAKPRAEFPNAPGRDTVQKVCGTCHGAEVVTGRGMNREEWGRVIASMVTRGAKGTEEEFAKVLDYLVANFPAERTTSSASRVEGAKPAPAPPRRAATIWGGADDKHIVDEDAANRGRSTYAAECVNCHGPKARGTDNGADIVRSVVVLRDRYGSLIGEFLAKGHQMQSGKSSATFTKVQVEDLSHFLHQQVYDTLRSGPYSQVINVLTGDAKAGAAYFNGEGKCSGCHSPTGDLAGVSKKYDPPTLQQRFVFPQTFGRRGAAASANRVKRVTVTVTPSSGQAVTGVLLALDDFNVALRENSGEYRSWKRTPELKVQKNDPYAAHQELLERYTDKDIHDVVAYLETLK